MSSAPALYPPLEPYKTERLRVDDIHELEVRHYGNAKGVPAVVRRVVILGVPAHAIQKHLHGGPGGGCDSTDPRRFDPAHYRVITYDQRGAGKSTPPSELENNTTNHLIDDLEKIRAHLGVERWLVHGGSWGSTLALAYAQAHPKRVIALVLRGIFLLRRSELEFFYNRGGTEWLFPEVFAKYADQIPVEEQGDMIAAYHKRLTSTNTEVRQKAARAWCSYEMATSRLLIDPANLAKADKDTFADIFSRIESHYFFHGGWLREGQLIEKSEIDKIRHIPATIVQGRYDVICPCKSAYDLHQVWPESELHIIPDAGHSARESGIEAQLVRATDKYRTLPR